MTSGSEVRVRVASRLVSSHAVAATLSFVVVVLLAGNGGGHWPTAGEPPTIDCDPGNSGEHNSGGD